MAEVSVIMATYNHGRYIGEAINSVMRQTFRDFELVVVVDGSTDDTLSVLRPLQEEHGFLVEVQENSGKAQALNNGVALSSGGLIVFFDSDDLMLPDWLEKQHGYMASRPEMGICGGNILRMDEQGRLKPRQSFLPAMTLTFDEVYLNRYRYGLAPRMVRRAALNEAGGFHPDIHIEDMYIAFKITSLGYSFGIMNDVLSCVRAHSGNISKNLEKMLAGVLQTYDCFPDHPEYERMRNRHLHQYLRRAIRQDRPLAWKILRDIPFKAYKPATLKSILRLLFS